MLGSMKPLTLAEAGRLGAAVTNKMLTSAKRRKAARKGWRLRKARLAR